jgi:tetratricopeptide (TPR) repeat protein
MLLFQKGKKEPPGTDSRPLILKIPILLFVVGWLAWSGPAWAEETSPLPGELLKVEGKKSAGRFQILIATNNPVNYKSFTLSGPRRLVINLTPCRKGAGKIPNVSGGPVEGLRSSQFNDDTVRLVLDLRRAVSGTLTAQAGDPFRLLVTFAEKEEGPAVTENLDPKPTKGPVSEKARERAGGISQPPPLAESKRQQEGDRGPAAANNRLPTSQPGEGQDLVKQIETCFEKGDHREVLRLFGLNREAFRGGAEPRLLQLVGNSYKALGFYDPAVRTFQAAWQGGAQGSPALVLDWAEALAGKGKAAEAASLIQTLLERPAGPREEQERAARLLVRCLYQQRRYPEALKTLETAGRRFPQWDQDPETRYLLGIVCFEIPGMGSKSLPALRQFVGVSQDPVKTAAAYEKIGDLCFENRHYEEAWRAYYQAGRLQPQAKGTFLAKKLTQCRLLVAERRPGSAPGNEVAETDPFWKKLSEYRAAQQKLEKKVSELRLN